MPTWKVAPGAMVGWSFLQRTVAYVMVPFTVYGVSFFAVTSRPASAV